MYRRTLVSSMLTPRRRRRPTAAAHASGAYTFLRTVTAITPAGENAVTLTLQTGERVTVTAQRGTVLFTTGILLTDRHNPESPDYLFPTPALIWEAKARLGLYSPQADHREWDTYLLSLPVITEACVVDDVLTLGCIGPDGRPGLQQFTGEPTVQLGRYEPGLDFTRFPLTATFREKGRAYAFRVDHTPAGYAVLAALGWNAPLPDLEDRR